MLLNLLVFCVLVFCCNLYRTEFLRHMRDFLQVVFKIEPLQAHKARQSESADAATVAAASASAAAAAEAGDSSALYVLSCKGIGYTNLSKMIR